MGAVGYAALLRLHQCFDALGHAVEVAGQATNFVSSLKHGRNGDAHTEIAAGETGGHSAQMNHGCADVSCEQVGQHGASKCEEREEHPRPDSAGFSWRNGRDESIG